MRQAHTYLVLLTLASFLACASQLAMAWPRPFENARTFPVGQFPLNITAGDFNRDGRADLVVANSGADTLSVLIGNGDGTFKKHHEYPVGGSGTADVIVGDFNNDGKLDLAVSAVTAQGSGILGVLLGNGDGTFQPPITEQFSNPLGALVAGDFNGDGKLDLVVIRSDNKYGSVLFLLLGNGDGTFQPPLNIAQGTSSVAAGDINHDGKLDLITTQRSNQDNDIASIRLGNGDGTFQEPSNYSVGYLAYSVVIADFNRDGRLDFAVASYCQKNHYCGLGYVPGYPFGGITVFVAQGDGTFKQSANLLAGGYPIEVGASGMAAADVDGDGNLDLINANGNDIAVFRGEGDGTFKDVLKFGSGHFPAGVAVGDFNGDHNLDIAVTNYGDSNVGVLLGTGEGKFAASLDSDAALYPPTWIATADFNRDGKMDVVVGTGNEISVLLGRGNGLFRPALTYSAGYQPRTVVTGDFNGDGNPDVAALSPCSSPGCSPPGTIALFMGNGDGTLQPPTYINVAEYASLAVGDFNHDGKLDLAVTDGDYVDVLLGNGDGTFQAPIKSPAAGPGYITAADLNGDGNLDIVATALGNKVAVLLGNGDGTFQKPVTYGVGENPNFVAVGDFNGDGKLDLAVTSALPYGKPIRGSITIFLGNGHGSFTPLVRYYVKATPTCVAVGDFDHDGIPDLAITDAAGHGLSANGSVGIWLGNGDGTFQLPFFYSADVPSFVTTSDFNGDGLPDLAMPSWYSDTIRIYLNVRSKNSH